MYPKNLHPGALLPNGSTIVTSGTKGDTTIILAVLGHNKTTPWATWACNSNNPESTYHGHYFNDIARAGEDFNIRSTK